MLSVSLFSSLPLLKRVDDDDDDDDDNDDDNDDGDDDVDGFLAYRSIFSL